MNKYTAQYTSRSAITAFVIFAYFENNTLNTDPRLAHNILNRKPTNAKRNAKNSRIPHCP